jgi:hypothetical protein
MPAAIIRYRQPRIDTSSIGWILASLEKYSNLERYQQDWVNTSNTYKIPAAARDGHQ